MEPGPPPPLHRSPPGNMHACMHACMEGIEAWCSKRRPRCEVMGIHLLSKSRTSQPGFGNELCHVSSRRNSERMTFHGWLLGTLVGVPEEAPPCQGYCSKKHNEFSDGKPDLRPAGGASTPCPWPSGAPRSGSSRLPAIVQVQVQFPATSKVKYNKPRPSPPYLPAAPGG